MLIASKKWEGYNLSLVRNRAINPALCLAGFVTRFPGNINLSIPSKDVDGVRRKETWAGQRLTGKVRDRRRLSQWLTFPFPFVHHQPWKEEVDLFQHLSVTFKTSFLSLSNASRHWKEEKEINIRMECWSFGSCKTCSFSSSTLPTSFHWAVTTVDQRSEEAVVAQGKGLKSCDRWSGKRIRFYHLAVYYRVRARRQMKEPFVPHSRVVRKRTRTSRTNTWNDHTTTQPWDVIETDGKDIPGIHPSDVSSRLWRLL